MFPFLVSVLGLAGRQTLKNKQKPKPKQKRPVRSVRALEGRRTLRSCVSASLLFVDSVGCLYSKIMSSASQVH